MSKRRGQSWVLFVSPSRNGQFEAADQRSPMRNLSLQMTSQIDLIIAAPILNDVE